MSQNKETAQWAAIGVSIFFSFISITFSVVSCSQSKQANEYYEKQANSASEIHNPYVGVITHFDDGNKKHGIFVVNYAEGLAIIDSIQISGENNPKLNKDKWHDILRKNGFTDNEISCFSFTLPHKGMGLSGKEEMPLIFVSSNMEEEAKKNVFFSSKCMNENLMAKLEAIDVQIFYKSRLPNSDLQKANVWKIYSNP